MALSCMMHDVLMTDSITVDLSHTMTEGITVALPRMMYDVSMTVAVTLS